MKYLRVMALTAVTATALWFLLGRPPKPLPPNLRVRNAADLGPDFVPVLSGKRDGVEVLVRRRYAHAERAAFTDASLCRALAIPESAWTFLEVLIMNGSQTSITPSELVLLSSEAGPIDVRTLGQVQAGDNGSHLVHALGSGWSRPLGTHALRRFLVAVPRGTTCAGLTGGTVLGIPLSRGNARREQLEAYLDQPGPELLEVMDRPAPEGAAGK